MYGSAVIGWFAILTSGFLCLLVAYKQAVLLPATLLAFGYTKEIVLDEILVIIRRMHHESCVRTVIYFA